MAQYNSQFIDPSDLKYIDFNQSPVLDKGKERLQLPTPSTAITSPTTSMLPLDINDENPPMRPSHDYGQYKQQTGLPTQPGHLRLLGNSQLFPNYNSGINENLFDGMNNSFDLNSPSDFNIEAFLENDAFDSPVFKQEDPQTHVRYYPGMHQQQAEQEKLNRQRQLQIEAEQERRAQATRRAGSHVDQRTEETIARVMSDIRRSSHISGDSSPSNSASALPHMIKARKAEDEMDEDERLLNSEEGKKLSSKERRQLRNKVSARAFRSRRKEYIGQLEEEVAAKTNECTELKRLNHALMQENAQFKALAEKLLAHSAFHPFLEELSRDPALAETLANVSASTAQSSGQQMPKDVGQFQASQAFLPPSDTHIGMALIPEIPVDLSALNIGSSNNWSLPSNRGQVGQFMQPQVFAVTEVPEPVEPIDFSSLSGKGGEDVLTQFLDDDEKMSYPEIETPPKVDCVPERASESEVVEPENTIDEDDETMTLFAPSKPSKRVAEPEEHENIFGTIPTEKAFAHFELFVSTEEDNQVLLDSFERTCARLEARCRRLQSMLGC